MKPLRRNPAFVAFERQYYTLRDKNRNHLLLAGYEGVYVAFADDARIIATALDEATTPAQVAGCFIPAEDADDVLQRLVHAGYGVAIAEATECPDSARRRRARTPRRAVVRIITPTRQAPPSAPIELAPIGARAFAEFV